MSSHIRALGLALATVASPSLLACGGAEALVVGADAAGGIDAAGGGDAAVAADAGADAPSVPGCGEFSGDVKFTCAKDGNSRGKCPGGGPLVVEPCPRGCLRMPTGADDVCMGTTDAFSCTGSYGTTRSTSGDYYLTAFGCWLDADGGAHRILSTTASPPASPRRRRTASASRATPARSARSGSPGTPPTARASGASRA